MKKTILNPISIIYIGLFVGMMAKYFDLHTEILGNLLSQLPIWVLIGVLIAVYSENEIEAMVQNIIVLVFTGLNGILILPYLGRLLDKINEDELTKKQFKKRIAILVVAIIVVFIFESNYLRGTQTGILDIYQKAINKG